MPFIFKSIISYLEDLDKVMVEDFKSIEGYPYFLRLAKIIEDKGI